MNTKNENYDFLDALTKLPLIRKNLMDIAQEIIQKTSNNNQENIMIDEKISSILAEMEINNLNVKVEDKDLLRYSIKLILTAQLPLSKMALKIRSLKKNPPESFQ
jgi:citrate lyase gamma subunit